MKASTGLVFLYAPAIIFPLILFYPSRWHRLAYFLFSIICYSLITVSLVALKLNFPSLAILFFISAAIMYLAYSILSGSNSSQWDRQVYINGLKAIFFFTVWYAPIVFICSLILKHDFVEGHITYIIVPAWYWVVGREIKKRVP